MILALDSAILSERIRKDDSDGDDGNSNNVDNGNYLA